MDELQLFRGKDYVINDRIKIHHPTLNDIVDYGEQNYYGLVSRLTAIPSDFKGQLDELGIDYEEISEFDLFILICKGLNVEETRILFGDLSFVDLNLFKNTNTDQPVLYNEKQDFIIDKAIYEVIMEFIRRINGFEKKIERAGNAATKKFLIEEAKEQLKKNVNKPFKSILIPLISSLVNSPEFKYDHNTVWNLPIYTFMDSVQRIQKIKNYDQLMQGAYSGCVDLKNVSKENLNWLGDLDK
jgi:hypothetical protein